MHLQLGACMAVLSCISMLRAESASRVHLTPSPQHLQFEQAATEVLKEHYADTEDGGQHDIQPVQIMVFSSTALVQSKTRSIRHLNVRAAACKQEAACS